MTDPIPRWVCAHGNSQMIEEPTGNYVHVNDVDALIAEAEQRKDYEWQRALAVDLQYALGYAAGLELHHKDRCCRVCDTHTMPHRGCILR